MDKEETLAQRQERKRKEEIEDIAWLKEHRKSSVNYLDCIALWKAVLAQIAEDATLGKISRKKVNFGGVAKTSNYDALDFIKTHDDLLDAICSVVGHSKRPFIKKIREINNAGGKLK